MKLLKIMANAIGPSLSSPGSAEIIFSSIGANEFLINFGSFAYWYTNIRSDYTYGTNIKVWPSGISFKPSNVYLTSISVPVFIDNATPSFPTKLSSSKTNVVFGVIAPMTSGVGVQTLNVCWFNNGIGVYHNANGIIVGMSFILYE